MGNRKEESVIKLFTTHRRLWFTKEIVFLEFDAAIVNLLQEDIGEISLVTYRLLKEQRAMLQTLITNKQKFQLMIGDDLHEGDFIITNADEHNIGEFRLDFAVVDY